VDNTNNFFKKIIKIITKIWKGSPIYIYARLSHLGLLDFLLFFSKKYHPFYFRSKKQVNYKVDFAKNSLKDQYRDILENYPLINDLFFIRLIANSYSNINQQNFRVNYRLNFFKNGFYMLFTTNNSKFIFKRNLVTFLSGWLYVWKLFSKWFLPLILTVSFVYYSLFIKSLPLNKILFVWLSLFMVFYWIMSGFVFFFKKYQYGKFTSSIQRFWKRTLILFWLIEGSLLTVFIFLTFNSSVYLYNVVDQSQIFKTHLFSWRLFLLKIIPTTILILLTYLFLLNNKWQPINKNLLFIMGITVLLFFILWTEFYQFYHLMNYYNNLVW